MIAKHSDRAHALLSASSSSRWLVCTPSAVASEAYPNQDTEFTREGTLAHEVAEAVVRGAQLPEGATAEMVEHAQEYAAYIEELKTRNDAIVLLEQRVDFSRWVPNGFGTSDCIIVQGDTMDVVDYKYGVGVAVSAKGNTQMRLYGLGALEDIGFAYNIKKVRLHIFQPRINNISRDEMTATELIVWGEQTVHPAALKAERGEGEFVPGEHCKFCPHAGRCRALTDLCTEHIKLHGMHDGEYAKIPVLAPHEVAEVLRMEPMISLWLKRVRDQALTTLLDGGTVPGYKVVEGRGSRTWSNEIEVANKLTDAGFSLEDITKTELLSPAAMEKAIGKKKAAELLTDLIDKKAGAPTVVLETDKRPAYDRLAEAQKDFN